MAAGVGEVAAVAAEAGATGGTAGVEGRATTLAGVIGCAAATAVLGPLEADALGVELTAGGGEVRRTRDRKE